MNVQQRSKNQQSFGMKIVLKTKDVEPEIKLLVKDFNQKFKDLKGPNVYLKDVFQTRYSEVNTTIDDSLHFWGYAKTKLFGNKEQCYSIRPITDESENSKFEVSLDNLKKLTNKFAGKDIISIP